MTSSTEVRPSHALGIQILTATSALGIVLGLAFVVGRARIVRLFQMAYGGGDLTPSTEADHLILLYGVVGAVMIGWLVLIVMLLRGPVRKGDAWAWKAVVVSAAVWFAIDTVFSLTTVFPRNAIVNLAFGALFAVGLSLTRPLAHTNGGFGSHQGP